METIKERVGVRIALEPYIIKKKRRRRKEKMREKRKRNGNN